MINLVEKLKSDNSGMGEDIGDVLNAGNNVALPNVDDFFVNSFDKADNQDVTKQMLSVVAKNASEFRTRTFKKKTSFHIYKSFDTCKTLELKFKLKDDSPETIQKLLYNLRDTSVFLTSNDLIILTIPRLLGVFLILDHIGKSIRVYNPKKYIEENGEPYKKCTLISNNYYYYNEEKMCMDFTYTYEDINDIYLIIPIPFDFFLYNTQIPICSLPFSEIKVELDSSDEATEEINKYINVVGLYPLLVEVLPNNNRNSLCNNSIDVNCVQVNSTCKYFKNGERVFNPIIRSRTAKMIFIIIEPIDTTEFNNIDLPTVEEVYIVCGTQGEIALFPSNFYICDYNTSRMYVISPNNQDAKAWMDICNETKGDIHTGQRLNETKLAYKTCDIHNIKIILGDYSVPIRVDLWLMSQQLIRYSSGLIGKKY